DDDAELPFCTDGSVVYSGVDFLPSTGFDPTILHMNIETECSAQFGLESQLPGGLGCRLTVVLVRQLQLQCLHLCYLTKRLEPGLPRLLYRNLRRPNADAVRKPHLHRHR